MKKSNARNIIRLVHKSFIPSIHPATQYIILKIVGFLTNKDDKAGLENSLTLLTPGQFTNYFCKQKWVNTIHCMKQKLTEKNSSQRWWCIYFLTKILSKSNSENPVCETTDSLTKEWEVIFISMENFSAWFSKNIKDSKIVCTILSKLPVWTSKPAPYQAALRRR